MPPVKLHCSMLAEDAIRAAVSDWKAKHEKNNVGGGVEKKGEEALASA